MPSVANALLNQHRKIIQETRKALLTFCSPKPGAFVLDIGCGNGDFTIQLAQKLGTQNVHGFDSSPSFVEEARKKGLQAICHDFGKTFPYRDSSFDVVCASQVFELTINTDLFIREIHRILRPDGYLLVSTPNLASLHNIVLLATGRLPPMVKVSYETSTGSVPRLFAGESPPPSTVRARMFTPSVLRGLLGFHGFEIQVIRGCGYYPFPHLIQTWLSRIDMTHAVQMAAKAVKTRNSK